MAVSIDTHFDVVTSWLIKVAENTARIRDSVMKPGAGGPAGESESSKSRTERALKALGDRFESTLARWQRTPVEQLITSAIDTSMHRLESGITSALSTARGLANRGFSGTVEGARYDYAMEQLSRQFAAVMQPVMQGLTYFTEQIERRMRMMSGGEQNRLLGAGVGAYVGLRAAGPLGAIAGAMLGGVAAGDPYSHDAVRGTAAGAYAGFRIAGPIGALFGGATGAAAGAPSHRPGEGPFEYYSRMRAEGSSRLGATLEMSGHSLAVLFGGIGRGLGMSTDMGRPVPAPAPRREEPRRDVTPWNPNMMEAGGTHFEIQKGVIRATAGEGEDAGPLKPFFDGMLQIIGLLAQLVGLAGGTPAPVPASGAGRT